MGIPIAGSRLAGAVAPIGEAVNAGANYLKLIELGLDPKQAALRTAATSAAGLTGYTIPGFAANVVPYLLQKGADAKAELEKTDRGLANMGIDPLYGKSANSRVLDAAAKFASLLSPVGIAQRVTDANNPQLSGSPKLSLDEETRQKQIQEYLRQKNARQ